MNSNENENVNSVHKVVKEFKDKRKYDRVRDRKDKRLYEIEREEDVNEADS